MLTTSRRDRPTVLLVDDDPAILDSLGQFLEGEGYRVIGAPDPETACACLEKKRIDLMILDVVLSQNRSGLDVLAFARLDRALEHVPAAILTGLPALSPRDEEIVRRFGALVFFKPHGYADLLNELRTRTTPRVH